MAHVALWCWPAQIDVTQTFSETATGGCNCCLHSRIETAENKGYIINSMNFSILFMQRFMIIKRYRHIQWFTMVLKDRFQDTVSGFGGSECMGPSWELICVHITLPNQEGSAWQWRTISFSKSPQLPDPIEQSTFIYVLHWLRQENKVERKT